MKKPVLNSLKDLSLVYSTNKDKVSINDGDDLSLIPKHLQKVRVQLYTKLKAGKSVSRIYGLQEDQNSLEKLCKYIKQKCGLGGSVKEAEIIIQGDQVEKIIKILLEYGYKDVKRSGG